MGIFVVVVRESADLIHDGLLHVVRGRARSGVQRTLPSPVRLLAKHFKLSLLTLPVPDELLVDAEHFRRPTPADHAPIAALQPAVAQKVQLLTNNLI